MLLLGDTMEIELHFPENQKEKEELEEALRNFHAALILHTIEKLNVQVETKEAIIEEIINRLILDANVSNKGETHFQYNGQHK